MKYTNWNEQLQMMLIEPDPILTHHSFYHKLIIRILEMLYLSFNLLIGFVLGCLYS